MKSKKLRPLLLLWLGTAAIAFAVWLPKKAIEVSPGTIVFRAASARNDSVSPRFVVLDDYIREYLGKEWDAHRADTLKLERGYCLRWQYDIWAGEQAYRITQISQADSVEAGPNGISFVCPKGPDVVEVHIHPAQTCIESRTTGVRTCWDGGPYAWQCLPSDADRNYLSWAKQPFGMVQCDRNAIRFYFPMGDNR